MDMGADSPGLGGADTPHVSHHPGPGRTRPTPPPPAKPASTQGLTPGAPPGQWAGQVGEWGSQSPPASPERVGGGEGRAQICALGAPSLWHKLSLA